METEPLARISRINTCSIGVSLFPEHYSEAKKKDENWFDYLLGPAMSAESRAKLSGRNCISLPVLESVSATSGISGDPLLWVVIGARLGWFGGRDGFQNEFQRTIAKMLFNELKRDPSSPSETIEKLRHEFAIELNEKEPWQLFSSSLNSSRIHPLLWLTVILHACLKSSFDGSGVVPLGFDIQLSSNPSADGQQLLTIQFGPATEVSIRTVSPMPKVTISAGKAWAKRELGIGLGRHEQKSMSPVLLMQIGKSVVSPVVNAASAATVEIDDRPVTGGGLPDFWQSNLSRIIRIASENRNICRIIITGDVSKAKKTISLLKEPQTWDLAMMNRRLSLDLAVLKDFTDREIEIEEVAGEIDARLYDAFVSEKPAPATLTLAKVARRSRLNVKLDEPGLPPTDGIKCLTAAEAYPRIISILRSESLPTNIDYFRREFVELTAFKLVLTKPMDEKIPDYWAEDHAEVESYYKREFGTSGLFGQRFYSWGGATQKDQVQNVLKESLQVISDEIASRRIMLFVADPADDLGSPLGLVCVQVLPRLQQGRWSISFNWIWRTVEALVGLPFSLYGSLRFSEDLVCELNQRLVNAGRPRISIENLTYVALSLHLFADEGDQHIARAIVTSAL